MYHGLKWEKKVVTSFSTFMVFEYGTFVSYWCIKHICGTYSSTVYIQDCNLLGRNTI
jgi:hypothetical protein